jgi:hypothetical protein
VHFCLHWLLAIIALRVSVSAKFSLRPDHNVHLIPATYNFGIAGKIPLFHDLAILEVFVLIPPA